MRDPKTLRFAPTHEWVFQDNDIQGGIVTVGISQFAIDQLTDIIVVDLPVVGKQLRSGDAAGEIESVKAVSDVYAPVDGEVVEINESLIRDVDALSRDPYGEGWLFKMRPSDPTQVDGLMDHNAYTKTVEGDHRGNGP